MIGQLPARQRAEAAVAEHSPAVGLIDEEQASIGRYVTQKALDGLDFMIAERAENAPISRVSLRTP